MPERPGIDRVAIGLFVDRSRSPFRSRATPGIRLARRLDIGPAQPITAELQTGGPILLELAGDNL
jgi:hypothetical protein